MTWSIPDRRRYLEDAKRTIEKSILRLQESCPHENKELFRYYGEQTDYMVLCNDCGKILTKEEHDN